MHNDLLVWQIINTTTWRPSDAFSVKNIFGYGELRQSLETGLFGTLWDAHDLNPFAPAGSYIDFAAISSIPSGNFAHQDTITDELRFAGNAFDRKLDYQGGAYYEESDPIGTVGQDSATFSRCSSYAPLLCNNPLGLATVSRTQTTNKYQDVGVYFQGNYAITDQWKVTAGVIYTDDRAENKNTSFVFSIPFGTAYSAPTGSTCNLFVGTLPNCTVSRSAHYSAPTWTFGLDYTLEKTLLRYAKYSRGYRAGNINTALPDALSIVQPEQVDTYEGGFKKTFTGRIPATLDVSAFYNDFRNQILRIDFNHIATNTAIAAETNAGRSRIYGLEVEGSLQPFKGFVINASMRI
jgi:iron complex outermembrane receptor protein